MRAPCTLFPGVTSNLGKDIPEQLQMASFVIHQLHQEKACAISSNLHQLYNLDGTNLLSTPNSSEILSAWKLGGVSSNTVLLFLRHDLGIAHQISQGLKRVKGGQKTVHGISVCLLKPSCSFYHLSCKIDII